jgi:hypothetical protein
MPPDPRRKLKIIVEAAKLARRHVELDPATLERLRIAAPQLA